MNQQIPHTIIITIDENGKLSGEVKGISGPHCGPLSAWLDELGEVIDDRQTPDYRKPAQQSVVIGR